MSRHLQVRVLLGVVAVAACGGPNSEAPCAEPAGEFPPTHCAYVTGTLAAAGAPLAGAGLQVSQFLEPVGYEYLSAPATTDASGRFSLLVHRQHEFRTPAVPDTATVYVRVFPSGPPPSLGAPTDDSVAVLMTFAPMGIVVDTTEVELTLP